MLERSNGAANPQFSSQFTGGENYSNTIGAGFTN